MKDIRFDFVLENKNTNSIAITNSFSLKDIIDSSGDDFIWECDNLHINSEYVDMSEEDDWIIDFELIAKRLGSGYSDKKGNEVFEGDIVQIYRHSFDTNKHEKQTRSKYKIKEGEMSTYTHVGEMNDIRQVIRACGALVLFGKNGGVPVETHFAHLDRPGQSIEVIGNIYANKDLLEQG